LAAVFDLAADADLIVTSGGASVGDHDLVGKTADALGMERAFYKIAMRPGKPLMAGRLRGIPMLGLPGNPVSSIVCGHVFMLPMIRAMQGAGKIAQTPQRAVLGSDTPANGPRAHYMRARLQHGDGGLLIFPYERQDSALLGVMAAADALMIRPVGGAALPAGAVVEYLPI
ncbi:molybdopterin-binding protein, partial [Pseudorhodobacter sp.]|uniref:molybdopterin-binding protein n=1 Tax=Pseudorhodobacter sp. TaxID=1934400 RepID=UPI00264987A1